MFGSIAPSYDRANGLLSFGIHHLWRSKIVEWSEAKAGDAVLDCATGTGDLAIAFKKVVGPSGGVVGSDFCKEMLLGGPQKARAQGLEILFEQADVTSLPYPDASFDITSIAFGIRNVPRADLAIQELHRVTKAGGRLMVLEFGQPTWPIWKDLFKFYSKSVLPTLGGIITGEPEAYRYLEKSSAQFPCGKDFVEMVKKNAPFKSVEMKSLTGGIAYAYKATK